MSESTFGMSCYLSKEDMLKDRIATLEAENASIKDCLHAAYVTGADFAVEFVLSHYEVGPFAEGGMIRKKEIDQLLPGSREHFKKRVLMWKRKVTEAIAAQPLKEVGHE